MASLLVAILLYMAALSGAVEVVEVVEVVFHGYADTIALGSGVIQLSGSCQSEPMKKIASSFVSTGGNWEFKANISTACSVLKTKYYSSLWGNEYLDSGTRSINTDLIKGGDVVIYTQFNNPKVTYRPLLDVYFELKTNGCESCFRSVTVCGKCEGPVSKVGKPETNRWNCGRPAVSSADGKQHLVKRSLFKGCNYQWAWKNLSSYSLESMTLRSSAFKTDCVTANQIQTVRSSEWGIIVNNDGECFTPEKITPDAHLSGLSTTSQPSKAKPSTEQPQADCCSDQNITLTLDEHNQEVEVEIILNHVLTLPAGKYKYSIWRSEKNCSQTISVEVKSPKLSCPKELRGVVSANTGRAGIELQLGEIHHKLELPVGKYPYMISTGQQNCSLSVKILDYRLIRRLELRSDYDVSCKHIDDSATKTLVMSTGQANYQQIQQICGTACGIPVGKNPTMFCTNDTMKLVWPTDVTFSGDVSDIPEDLKAKLMSAIESKGSILQIVVLNQNPPVVFPRKTANGGSAYLHLATLCTDSYVYDELSGECRQ